MKKCTYCKNKKPFRDFYKGKTVSCGFFFICAFCRPFYSEERKKKHSITVKAKYWQKKKENEKEHLIILESNKKERERNRLIRISMKVSKIKVERTPEKKKRHSFLQGIANKRKKSESPIFKLLYNLRNRNYFAFKNFKNRSKTTTELLGIEIEEAKKYIEGLFYINDNTKQLMYWDSYGKGPGKWQIDHRQPLASAITEEELYSLCHYSNLQPLWHEDHAQKTLEDIKLIAFVKKSNKINDLTKSNDSISQS